MEHGTDSCTSTLYTGTVTRAVAGASADARTGALSITTLGARTDTPTPELGASVISSDAPEFKTHAKCARSLVTTQSSQHIGASTNASANSASAGAGTVDGDCAGDGAAAGGGLQAVFRRNSQFKML